jgi:RND superfamily putative drug exporter
MDTITRSTGGNLARLAGWAQRHRWLAVALWALVLIGVTFTSQLAGSAFHDDNSLPGTESQQVVDMLGNTAQSGASAQIVLKADGGLAANRAPIETMLREVRSLPHVRSVTDPAEALSPDGRIGYATVTFDAASTDLPYDDIVKFADTAKQAGPVEVALAGDPIARISESGGPAEGVGLLAALVILVFLFRSLLAAGLPVITAVFAVGSTLGVITVVSHFVDIASYTAPLMMLVGFGAVRRDDRDHRAARPPRTRAGRAARSGAVRRPHRPDDDARIRHAAARAAFAVRQAAGTRHPSSRR